MASWILTNTQVLDWTDQHYLLHFIQWMHVVVLKFQNQEDNSCKMYIAFNMCRFIQPDFVVRMLNNIQTWMHSMTDNLFVCPPEVEYK